jgi:glycosyl transferase family 21
MSGLLSNFVWLVVGSIVLLLFVFDAAALWALAAGYFELRRKFTSSSNDFADVLLKSPLVPGISVIDVQVEPVPEALARVRRLLDLHFGRNEVVLVLDGPSPADLAVWTEQFRLAPVERSRPAALPGGAVRCLYISRDPLKLLVVEKERGGRHEALNAGVNYAQFPVIGLVDGEAEFVPELLLHLVRPMLEEPEGVNAVCAVAPPPVPAGLAGYIGALEWARVWLARCAACSTRRRMIPVPGSSCLLRRDAVVAAGGFTRMADELFARGAVRTAFVARRVSWPAAPREWGELRRRAERDQHRLAPLVRGYAWRGGIAARGLFVARILRPLFETAALVLAAAGLALGWIAWPVAGLVLVGSAGFGIVISMAALVAREFADPSIGEPVRLAAVFLAAIPENLGYRQLRNLWLIRASFARN